MSYTAVAAVRESDLAPTGLRLVAWALADAASSTTNDGGGIALSVRSVANRCAISDDQAGRHIKALLAARVLVLESASRGPKDPNRYRLDLDELARRRCSWAVADEDRRALRRGVNPRADAGGADAGGTDARGTYATQPPAPMPPNPPHGRGGIPRMDAPQSPVSPGSPNPGEIQRNRSTPPARRAAAGAATVAGGLPAGNGESAGGPVDPADIRGTPENLRKRGLPDFRGFRPAGWNVGAR